MSKKVCMLSPSAMIFDARIQKEAQSLRDAGYQVTIVFTEDQNTLDNVADLPAVRAKYNTAMAGIISIPVYLHARKLTTIPRAVRRILQATEMVGKFTWAVLKNKADYYHCHDLSPAIFALLGKFLYRAKVVYDAHEFEVPDTNGFINRLWLGYERNMMRRCAAAITVNESIAAEMASRYGKPVNVILNRARFVEPDLLQKANLRTQLNLPPDSKIVMYVGYLCPGRGIEQTVAALAHLPDNVYFCIMGSGNVKAFKEQLAVIVQSLNIRPGRVIFIGPYPPQDVVYFLSDADVSVLLYQTGTDENSSMNTPNKLSQSIMARVPILASHNRTLPEDIYRNAVGIIGETVNEKDPAAIAERITYMLDTERSETYRKNEGLLAYNNSWIQEQEKLIKIYSEVDEGS